MSGELIAGRVRSGPMATTDYDGWNGAFLVEVGSARLTVICSDATGWEDSGLTGIPWEHISVSLPNRCPTWPEMDVIKRMFWADEEAVIQFHPPESVKRNHHQFCLHMWRPVGVEIPMPPPITVAPDEVKK